MSPGTNGKGDTTLAARLGTQSRPDEFGPRSSDVSFNVVFAPQIASSGRRCDVVVGLSASGDSPGAVRACDRAVPRRGGGRAGQHRPSVGGAYGVSTRIQEAQTTIYHTPWELTLNELTTGRARSGTSRATPGRSWSRGS